MEKAKRRNLSVNITIIILLIGMAVNAVVLLKITAVYNSGREITAADRCADRELLAVRSKNWKQIASKEQLSLTYEDLQCIDSVDETAVITAELARQFLGASDDEILDNITYYGYYPYVSIYDNSVNRYDSNDHYVYREKTGNRLLLDTMPSYLYNTKYPDEPDCVPVARDGLVFFTCKDNPVDSITSDQLYMIYSGQINNWNELGGNDEEIRRFRRISGSFTQNAMYEQVLGGWFITDRTESYSWVNKAFMHGRDEYYEVVSEFESIPGSIGFAYCYYLERLYDTADIKVLKIDGVYPDKETIRNGTYPYVTEYYAYLTGEPEGKPAELRDYLLTEEGQKIIETAGLCPVLKFDDEEE